MENSIKVTKFEYDKIFIKTKFNENLSEFTFLANDETEKIEAVLFIGGTNNEKKHLFIATESTNETDIIDEFDEFQHHIEMIENLDNQ